MVLFVRSIPRSIPRLRWPPRAAVPGPGGPARVAAGASRVALLPTIQEVHALPTAVDNAVDIFASGGRCKTMSGIWESALTTIESRINRHYFEMWFKPISCAQVAGDQIVLRAPNRYI